MSSDNPPYPYYNGIPFNPSFFTSTSDTGSGLSETAANALYLRKTVPDTASALETFNGGIITPSLSSTGSLNIVMPNALATDVLNVGVVSRNIAGQIHHYSDGDNCVAGAGVHINNGNNNASSTNIMNGSNTSGTLNLMTGGGTNAVNIGSSSTTLTSVGILRLNNTGSATTNIGDTGLTTLNGSAVNINTLNGTDTTIGKAGSGTTSLNNPTVNLGRVGSSTTTVRGSQVNISGTVNDITGITNINGVGSTNGQLITIGNPTAGTTTLASDFINIGNIDTLMYLEGSSLNIQNAASSSLNLMTASSLGSVANIMTGDSNTSTLSVGNTGTTVGIKGIVNINTSGTANTSIGVAGSTTAILGTTNINTTGTANTSIGVAGSTTAILGTTNINTTGTTATSIGATGSNVSLGQTTGAGLITINKPLNVGYGIQSRSLANLSQLGAFWQVIESNVTISTTLTARAYAGLVPNGRYQLGVFVFVPALGAVGDYVTKLAFNNSSFSNGSITGFQTSTANEGQIENFVFKPNTTSIMSISSSNPQDVGGGYGYMAVAISGPSSVSGCKVVFNVVRLG